MEPMIQITEAVKSYHSLDADSIVLNQLSFSVQTGDMISIMGRSGSGKTTLLNCIGLLDSFTSGTYLLKGRDISSLSRLQLNSLRKETFSYIFQSYELMDAYNVFENIEVPLLARNVQKKVRHEKVLAIAKSLRIDAYLKNYPRQLSGGEQQRVAVARAIIADTPVILADEPSGALDQETAGWLVEILQALNRQGKTILIVTHDSKVASICQKQYILQNGILSRR